MFEGHDVTPKSCACRLVYWLGYVTAVVVLAAYSATLISFLTIQNKDPPFKTLEALAADKSYELGLSRQYLRIIRHVRLHANTLPLEIRKFGENLRHPLSFKSFSLTDEVIKNYEFSEPDKGTAGILHDVSEKRAA